MRPLPPDRRGYGVFTAVEARAHGWSDGALRYAVRTGELRRLRPGVFVPTHLHDPDDRDATALVDVVAAVAVSRIGVASHVSAAVLAGLPLWNRWRRPCLTVPPGYSGDLTGGHLHRAQMPIADLVPAVVPRLSVARTVVDLAREHGMDDAVVAADAALARGLVDDAAIIRVLARCAGWPGVRRARQLVDVMDQRAESPLESVSRWRLARAGLPAPAPQTELRTPAGAWIGRVDFYWDEVGVVGEVDGRTKYRDYGDDVLWREKLRQERLERAGLIVVRWTAADLRDMDRLVARLRSAFARGAARTGASRAWTAA